VANHDGTIITQFIRVTSLKDGVNDVRSLGRRELDKITLLKSCIRMRGGCGWRA